MSAHAFLRAEVVETLLRVGIEYLCKIYGSIDGVAPMNSVETFRARLSPKTTDDGHIAVFKELLLSGTITKLESLYTAPDAWYGLVYIVMSNIDKFVEELDVVLNEPYSTISAFMPTRFRDLHGSRYITVLMFSAEGLERAFIAAMMHPHSTPGCLSLFDECAHAAAVRDVHRIAHDIYVNPDEHLLGIGSHDICQKFDMAACGWRIIDVLNRIRPVVDYLMRLENRNDERSACSTTVGLASSLREEIMLLPNDSVSHDTMQMIISKLHAVSESINDENPDLLDILGNFASVAEDMSRLPEFYRRICAVLDKIIQRMNAKASRYRATE